MTKATQITLTAHSYFGGECVVRITESGYDVISDTRTVSDGYLHLDDNSPEQITDALRDSMLRYFFNHPLNSTPGIGATPQKYFRGLSILEREQIGNNGQRGTYA